MIGPVLSILCDAAPSDAAPSDAAPPEQETAPLGRRRGGRESETERYITHIILAIYRRYYIWIIPGSFVHYIYVGDSR